MPQDRHHLNKELYCAIGTYYYGQELLEVAAIPLKSDFSPSEVFPHFDMKIQPRRPIPGDYHKKYFKNGRDYFMTSELFVEWFEKLKLLPGKKIVPVVYNWSTTRPYLIEWLQPLSYRHVFSRFYRDLYVAGQFLNDVYSLMNIKTPFRSKMGLRRFISELGVETVQQNITVVERSALDQARYVAECYRKMLPLAAFYNG